LHRIFDGVLHPVPHLAEELIGNVGELHTRDATLFIRPFQTASALDTSLFVQIKSKLHLRFRAHPSHGAETETVLGQIKNHASIAWLYFNIEQVFETFPWRLPAFEVISHARSSTTSQPK
jgi:hypothetical protein